MNSVPAHKDTIMVHCLATTKSWARGKTMQQILDEVTDWHVNDRGWSDVAYAEIIGYEGDWIGGRDLDDDGDYWEETGAGARGFNKNVIHLALVGGHGSTENDDPMEHFTEEQLLALRWRIMAIQDAAGRKMKVRGHNEVAAKACPGFNVKRWWNGQSKQRPVVASKAVQTSALGLVSSGTAGVTAVSQLEGNSQIVALVFCGLAGLLFLYLMRDRLAKFAAGVR